MENRWKLYSVLFLIVLTLVLFNKVYKNYLQQSEDYQLKSTKLEALNIKLKNKIKTYKKLQSEIKIEEKRLKNFKNRLFKAHNPNEVLENLQKYLFDYFQKQKIDINNYRQLRLIEAKYYYKCRFEINTIMDFDQLINIFEFLDNSNYLIKIPEINVYYTRRNRENKIRVRMIFETIYIKEALNELKI